MSFTYINYNPNPTNPRIKMYSFFNFLHNKHINLNKTKCLMIKFTHDFIHDNLKLEKFIPVIQKKF